MKNKMNLKRLLLSTGATFALFVYIISFAACSNHILDIEEALQTKSTPPTTSTTPEGGGAMTTPTPEPTPTPPAPEPNPEPELYDYKIIPLNDNWHFSIFNEYLDIATCKSVTDDSITFTLNRELNPNDGMLQVIFGDDNYEADKIYVCSYKIQGPVPADATDSIMSVVLWVTKTQGYRFSTYNSSGPTQTSFSTTCDITETGGILFFPLIPGEYTISDVSVTETPTSPAPTTYTVTATSGEHGIISVDKTIAAAGETVIITLLPDSGYVRNTLTATDSSGNNQILNNSAVKQYSFTMPESNVTVNGTFKTVGTITMKTGLDINTIFKNNVSFYIFGGAEKFVHSEILPTGVTTFTLSQDSSEEHVYAWLDGKTIKFYAEGYTDSNKKIPLNVDSSRLFYDCTSLKEINMIFFDTSEVKDMSYMFDGCQNLSELNISNFDTSRVRDMRCMFDYCKKLSALDIFNFDTSNVYDMTFMFSGCENLSELNLSSFDTSIVDQMRGMFDGCLLLAKIIVGDNFDTSKVTGSSNMFNLCKSLVGEAGTSYNDSNPKDKTYARIDGGPSSPGYFTSGN